MYLGSEDAGALPLAELQTHKISHILIPAYTGRPAVLHPNSISYMHLNLRDVQGVPIIPEFKAAFAFIDEGLKEGAVLVHCAQGISRSASFVVAYLMQRNSWTLSESIEHVRQRRPCIDVLKKFGDQLRLWEEMHCSLRGDTPAHKTYVAKYSKQVSIGRQNDIIPARFKQLN
uniref:Protein-tyrosine-phosphatase n=1 Tax=Arcella intermedia TaxID=1963864 RepID=A0A6B2LKN1_9EUKA